VTSGLCNFDDFWRVAAKVTPTSTPGRPQSPTAVPSSSASAHTRPPLTDPNSVLPDRDRAFAVRSVPVRIYLPDGPVLQELAPPLRDDGASSPDNPRIRGANG
jgi:autophagy-related protein 5